MICQPKVIVRTHVEHALSARDRNVRILRTRDDTLGFKKTLRLNFFESLSHLIFEFGYHGVPQITQISAGRKRNAKPRNGAVGKGATWTGSPEGSARQVR